MANRFSSPNQSFISNTGVPYAGGMLYFYASGTSTPLSTFQDSALSIPNTNPIVLDSNGQAGSVFLQNLAYKVVLTDSNFNQVWTEDPVYTSDYSTSAQFQIYNGNPNGFVAGNQGAVGGNPASVVWDATDQLLYICTTTGSASTAVWTAVNTTPLGIVPSGVIWAFGGASAPVGWLLCGGQAVSRTTYATLYGVIGTTFGSGDGATTFNVPDLRGTVPAGQDTMVQGAANRLTSTGSGVAGNTIGASGGSQNQTIAQSGLPNITPTISITDPGHSHYITFLKNGGSVNTGAPIYNNVPYLIANSQINVSDSTSTTGITAASSSINGGVTQTTTTTVPPVLICTYIIKT